ncbi:CrcB family protein [Paenibacillus thermoaerophilus]|nr:CrcB family protein [Paenibacillus thermoaerophilus]
MDILLVAAGGFAGAVVRAAVSEFANRPYPRAIPYGTLSVNVAGSFLIGCLSDAGAALTLLASSGFCGALTTFSTLSWELLRLGRQDKRRAVVYGALSYGLGLAATAAGLWLS